MRVYVYILVVSDKIQRSTYKFYFLNNILLKQFLIRYESGSGSAAVTLSKGIRKGRIFTHTRRRCP